MVVMVIHSRPLGSSPPLLEHGSKGFMVRQSLSLKSSQLPPGKGKVWCAELVLSPIPPLLGNRRKEVMVIYIKVFPLLENRREGGNRHTQSSSEKLMASRGKRKGWWSWSYTAFLWKAFCLLRERGRGGVLSGFVALFIKALLLFWEEMEGMVVTVIHSLSLESSRPLLGKGSGCGHGHTQPSSGKLSSSYGKGKGWRSWSYTALL